MLRAGEIEQEKINEVNRTRSDANALIARLRKQAVAKPSPAGGVSETAPACEGPAGGGLSDRSREDTVRLAERANTIRAALSACYSVYDAL